MNAGRTVTILVFSLGVTAFLTGVCTAATPMGTAFTYQGQLLDAGQPLSGFYDLQFKLFDGNDTSLGAQVGDAIDIGDRDVVDGRIVVELDFGSSAFKGDARWLEIGVRPGLLDDPEPYTILPPRTELKPVPYALHTRGILLDEDAPGNVFVGYDTGSSNTAGGKCNTFIGYGSGFSNSSGGLNTFLGYRAGRANIAGSSNTFLGYGAGYSNTKGGQNTCIGCEAGRDNTISSGNTFIGYHAGWRNDEGTGNTFVGQSAGSRNTDGNYNTFVGIYAGQSIEEGWRNTFIGSHAGHAHISGGGNTFLGHYAGFSHTKGSNNTFIGYNAGESNTAGTGNVFIGYMAGTNEQRDNKLYIANKSNSALIFGDFAAERVGINTRFPDYALDVWGDIQAHAYHTGDIFFQKDGEQLWRMFEDREGLYVENLSNGKVYAFVLQETEDGANADGAVALDLAVRELKAENELLQRRLAALEKAVQELIVAAADGGSSPSRQSQEVRTVHLWRAVPFLCPRRAEPVRGDEVRRAQSRAGEAVPAGVAVRVVHRRSSCGRGGPIGVAEPVVVA